MAFYFLELPGTDVKAEVEAPSTRSAQTSYLDYLTRNQIVPWKGRNALRSSIIVDRIESGQMPVDVNLNYNLEQGGVSEPETVLGPQPVTIDTFDEPEMDMEVPVSRPSPSFTPRTKRPGTLADLPEDLPTPEIGASKLMPIQQASKTKLSSGGSKIEQLSRSTLGKGKF